MQKIINVLAVASAAVSVAVVGLGGYVYLNREAIIEDVKEKALGGLGGSLGGAGLGGDLPIGAPDLAAPDTSASAPNVPSGGLGVPTF
jgi:hypothetical protein